MPGPTIEAEHGRPVTVQCRNELDGALPVVATTAPKATDTSGVPAQCVPGLSGGTALTLTGWLLSRHSGEAAYVAAWQEEPNDA